VALANGKAEAFFNEIPEGSQPQELSDELQGAKSALFWDSEY